MSRDAELSAHDPHAALAPGASRTQAVRYGAYMLRRFGWFYHLLGLGRLLGRLRLEEHSVDRIRAAYERGPIVYVLLNRSTVDHLALNTVLNDRRLPLSVWANGVTAFTWQPVIEAWRDVGRRVRALLSEGRPPDPVRSGWLSRTVASGAPVTVFLEDAGVEDPLGALLEAQETAGRPVQLLPVVVVWSRAPQLRGGTVQAFLQGATRASGVLDVLLRSRGTFVQVGDPVDLREFRARVDAPDRPRALRTLLRRFLRRESRLVRGPTLLPWRDLERVVLDNPPMRALARQEAEARGTTQSEIRRQMERDYRAMAARFRFWVVRSLDVLLRPLWTKVFSGVDVREEDLERIRTAMRGGAAVLVPSHKSHFDYLLLSWVFYANDLIVPHVVAGMNLAFWPVSFFLRAAGGFFVKRSFSGDRVFPAVFSRYLRELLRQGYPVEFFIEGGRTRSGKLLPPRLGVLGMVLDAAAIRPTGHEVTLLPISLAYEQVAEAGAYARELSGGEKEPESIGQVVKAGSVLGRRYGRVYLRVGEPIATSPLVDDPPWAELDRRSHKEALQRVGERILYRIGRATVLLPTSLVALSLLAHHRRGVLHADLLARCDRFRALLAWAGAEEAASLRHYGQAVNQALQRLQRARLVETLEHPDGRVWSVHVDRRITLEFYKNQVLHYLATAGYAAIAIRTRPEGRFSAEDLRPAFLDLVWLFRREFILDPDRSGTALLAEGLEGLRAHGAITGDEVADPVRIGEIYGLFRNLLEGYAVVLRHAARHLRRPQERKELARLLQGERDVLLASGEVTRPEALSMITLENAVTAFEEDGVFRRDPHGHLVLDEAARARRLEHLEPLLR